MSDPDELDTCSSPDCGGVCTYEGYCTCTLHGWPNGLGKTDPDHEPPERYGYDS
jgi:hypothetical protein